MPKFCVAVLLAAAGSVSAAEFIDFNLDPDQQVTVSSGPTDIMFGVEGNARIDIERDGDGKLADARLAGLDLNVLSASVYDFGALGLVTLSNIGVTLAEPGGQEFFFNETSGSSQPGDFAGFLDTSALADLTGILELDADRDGLADTVTDLALIDPELRRFDFEASLFRDAGETDYRVTTFFNLFVETTAQSLPISFDISFNGGGPGFFVPTPGSMSLAALVGALFVRRRRESQ